MINQSNYIWHMPGYPYPFQATIPPTLNNYTQNIPPPNFTPANHCPHCTYHTHCTNCSNYANFPQPTPIGPTDSRYIVNLMFQPMPQTMYYNPGNFVYPPIYPMERIPMPTLQPPNQLEDFKRNYNPSEFIIFLCRTMGIKLLAFDFDLTLVDFNTRGLWFGKLKNLAEHFRPCFKELINAVLTSGQLQVCIVTFSPQPKLIRRLFRHFFGKELTKNLIIESNAGVVVSQLNPQIQQIGKLEHLEKVRNKILATSGVKLEPHEIMLVDDRSNYCSIARKKGYKAFVVTNDVSLLELQEYLRSLMV